MAGMLPLLVSKIGHQTDLALRSQEEMDMVIKEAQAAKHEADLPHHNPHSGKILSGKPTIARRSRLCNNMYDSGLELVVKKRVGLRNT
jgi:hypothetical protein